MWGRGGCLCGGREGVYVGVGRGGRLCGGGEGMAFVCGFACLITIYHMSCCKHKNLLDLELGCTTC